MQDIIHISLGENCLIDSLLIKYKIKKESYPFGSVRTNIEYNFEIIKDNFKDLLNPDFLFKKIVDGNRSVIKNRKYKFITKNIYDSSVHDNFEFTHHNVLENQKDRESFKRKITRMKYAIENNNILFWYHYRFSKNNDLNKLIDHFNKFLNYLSKKSKGQRKYIVCIFTQIPSNKKNFNHINPIKNIHIIQCYDERIWSGNNVGGTIKNLQRHSFRRIFDIIFQEYYLHKKITESFYT